MVTGSVSNTQNLNFLPWLYTSQHGYNSSGEPSVASMRFGQGVGYAGDVYKDAADPQARPFIYGPDAAFFNFQTKKPIYPLTAIMSGRDETHTDRPISQNQIGSNRYISAAVAAIQTQALSSIAPVIGVDPVAYDSAAGTKGAPEITTVPNAAGIIELFNSAASRFTLNSIEDQKLFETYYNAVSGLRGPAPRSTWQPQLKIAKGAAKLIGLNFAAELTPTQTDLDNYGLTALGQLIASGNAQGTNQPAANSQIHTVSRDRLMAFGRCMISTAKAMKLGLTNAGIISLSPFPTNDVFFTDPHETFTSATNMRGGRSNTRHLALILNAFYADLADAQLDKKCVSMYYGDTPHSPAEKGAWPDATVQGSNWIYLMSHGYIKEGWFGAPMHGGGQGNNNGERVYGFDRYGNTSDSSFMNVASDTYSTAAGAAVAYSVARGDWNTAAEFYSGAKITGMIKA
jgi:hypothetical protein